MNIKLTPDQIATERLRLLLLNREAYDRLRVLTLHLIRAHGCTEEQRAELSGIERLHSSQYPQHGDFNHE